MSKVRYFVSLFVVVFLISIFQMTSTRIVSANRLCDDGAERFANKVVSDCVKIGTPVHHFTVCRKIDDNTYRFFYIPGGEDSKCQIIMKIDADGYVDTILIMGSYVNLAGSKNVGYMSNACLKAIGLSYDEAKYLIDNLKPVDTNSSDKGFYSVLWSNTLYKEINYGIALKADGTEGVYITS